MPIYFFWMEHFSIWEWFSFSLLDVALGHALEVVTHSNLVNLFASLSALPFYHSLCSVLVFQKKYIVAWSYLLLLFIKLNIFNIPSIRMVAFYMNETFWVLVEFVLVLIVDAFRSSSTILISRIRTFQEYYQKWTSLQGRTPVNNLIHI